MSGNQQQSREVRRCAPYAVVEKVTTINTDTVTNKDTLMFMSMEPGRGMQVMLRMQTRPACCASSRIYWAALYMTKSTES